MGRRTFIILAVVTIAALSTSPAAASQLPKTDKAIARSGLLTLADFSAGWTEHPASQAKPSKLKSCRRIESMSKASRRYQETSPDFTRGDARVSNSVFVFPDIKTAKAYLAPFHAGGSQCLNDSVLKAVPDATVIVRTVDATAFAESGIDDAIEFVVRIDQPTQGGGTQTYADLEIAMRIGRTVFAVSSFSPDEPLSELDRLVEQSLSRLLAAKTKA